MKNIRKIMSAILALTLVLTSNIIPAMACTVEYDGHEPKVIPCEQVAEKGYCDTLILHYGSIGGEMRPLVNPYYKDTAEVTETPVTMPIESEPVATEAPVETTPVEEQPFADVTVTEVVPCKYDSAWSFSEGLAAVELDRKLGFIDKTGKEVVPLKYNEVNSFSEGLAAVKLDDKWGFIDKTGKKVVPCKYDRAWGFSEGLAVVWLDGKCGFIDQTGKEVVPCKYDRAWGFSEGLAAVELNGKCGFIDKTGKEVVPCKYDAVGYCRFFEGLAAVNIGGELDGKWGFIDKTGKEVVPCKYTFADNFSEGLAAVCGENYKWGFVDKTGKEVIPCQYQSAGGFTNGCAVVEASTGQIKNGKTVYAPGVIDAQGNVVVPFGKYDEIKQFSDGLAAVMVEEEYPSPDKWGFIDTTGKEVVPCKYTNYDVPVFHDGLAAVRGDTGEKDKWGNAIVGWGFVDKTGQEVVPCTSEYNYAENFSEGLAAVSIRGASPIIDLYGFIDKTGQEVIPCIWEYDTRLGSLGNFSDGLAVVQTSNGWGCIDLHGNEVIPCQYGGVELLSAGTVAVQLDNKWGILRVEGLPTEPKPAPAPTPTPTPQQPTATTAYASTQTVTVDGKSVTFYAYALKDANGNDTNYIKLRDVAQILNGSAAQFQVGWDGSISITTKTAYTPNGSENIQNFKGNQTYAVSTSPVTVNGQPTNLEAITLTDANGGGYTYFKLRDLGAALGFNVGWNGGIFIESDKPYNANN